MAKITAPVSLGAVRAALGLPAADLAALCRNDHGRTHRWARHKPVRHPSLRPLTAAQLAAVDHGMMPPEGAVGPSPFDPDWQQLLWSYAAPRGAAYGEPYRLSDWNGYATDADAPATSPGTLHISPLDTAAALTLRIGSGMVSVIGTDTLSLRDFDTIAPYYPCVAISFTARDGTTYTRLQTAASTFADGAGAVSIKAAALLELLTDRFDYFLCGCSACQTTLAPPPAARFIILPSDTPLRGEILKSDSLPVSLRFDRVCAGNFAGAILFFGHPVDTYSALGTIIPMPDGDIPIGGEPGGTLADSYKYLNVGSRATISLSMSITNHSSSPVRIPRGALRCRVNRNLAGTHSTPHAPAAALAALDGSRLTATDAIELPAGATRAYAIAWPDYCCIQNAGGGTVSVPPRTRRFNASSELLHGSGSTYTTLASIGINIANY